MGAHSVFDNISSADSTGPARHATIESDPGDMSPGPEGWKRPIEYQDSHQIAMTPDWDAFFLPFATATTVATELA